MHEKREWRQTNGRKWHHQYCAVTHINICAFALVESSPDFIKKYPCDSHPPPSFSIGFAYAFFSHIPNNSMHIFYCKQMKFHLKMPPIDC